MIYTGNEIENELITPSFSSQLTKTFKSLLNALKFNSPNSFIENNYFLFAEIPKTDTLKKINEFSFTPNNKLKLDSINSIKSSMERIKTTFNDLYSSGVRNGVKWKEIDTESFHFTVQNRKHIELKYRIKDEEFVIEVGYVCDNGLDKCRIWVSNINGESQPLNVYNYKQKINLNLTDWVDKKIDYEEYMKNQITIVNRDYPNLSKTDLKYIENSCYTKSCIYTGFGDMLLIYKEYSDAIENFNIAMKASIIKDYNFYHSIFGIGYCKLKLEDYHGAINTFNQIDIKYKDYLTFYSLGLAEDNLNNFKQAFIYYNISIKKDSTFCWSYLRRGDLEFIYLNDTKMACNDWSKAGELGCEEAYEKIKKYCN